MSSCRVSMDILHGLYAFAIYLSSRIINYSFNDRVKPLKGVGMYIPVIVVEKRNKHNDLHTTNVRIPGVYDNTDEARQMGASFINSYLFDLMKSDEFIKSGAGTEKDNKTGQECVISIVEFEHTIIEIRLFIMHG